MIFWHIAAGRAHNAPVPSVDGAPETACLQEPCHQLAWTLDACINDKKLGARRLDTLRIALQPYDRPASSAGDLQECWLVLSNGQT